MIAISKLGHVMWRGAGALMLVLSLGAAASVALAGSPDRPAHASAVCGVERWSVKTLSDSGVSQVNFNPKDTTISALRAIPAPHVGFSTPRIAGVETTTYRVKAKLLEFKIEDDRDVHLVIAPSSSPLKTMIVEFPDTACPGARSSPKKTQMKSVRAALLAGCGPASKSAFTDLQGSATITGVGFFDVKHGQTGVAPNGIELHPVLALSKLSCGPR